jgi:eukaryotic-like serine/threonine-protein kinase
VSLPYAARSDDTVPTEPKVVLCPKCRTHWPHNQAPEVCPKDGAVLVKERELVDAEADPMVGRTLEGRYTILARLGAGSMGTVYRAKQHAMGREVAIKILRGDRAADDPSKARFMREARANSLLASPNTVTVFDFGQSESGEFYLAMELLEGESVGQRLTREGKIPAAIAVDTARQALRSLAEAHAKGIIHRDLKPDNLFYARVIGGGSGEKAEEIVKVLDFGIAKMLRDDDEDAMLGERGVVETQAGTVFGTPRYMSPEQAQGKPLDARSDLYSLGVILYQMLTGRPPFTDNDAVVVMARHIKSTPKRPNEANPEAGVPKELEDVIMRTLAKEPQDRPANAEVLAGQLLAALEAQGAMSSGVRASITNAAGIRVPDSLRPPAVALPAPPAKSSAPLIAIIAALVLVVAAVSVYLGMRGAKTDPTKEGPKTTASVAAPTTTTPSTSTTDTAPKAVEPPTVTPDSLPKATVSTTPGKPIPGGKNGPKTRPTGNGRTPGTSTAPATSATGGYGIFE